MMGGYNLMKNVFLSILDLTVNAFKLHCKKTVTLVFPRVGKYLLSQKVKNLVRGSRCVAKR